MPTKLLRKIVYALLFVPLLITSGCSSFNHAWKQAATQTPADGLQGRWLGHWKSDSNGHNGLLRCIITKGDDGIYRARFHAKYARMINFHYTIHLQAMATADGFDFNGQENLGWYAGGIYSYTGHAGGTNFFSTYSSKYDKGTFQMQRP